MSDTQAASIGYVLCDSTGVVWGPFDTLEKAVRRWEGTLSLRRQDHDGVQPVTRAEYERATRLARRARSPLEAK